MNKIAPLTKTLRTALRLALSSVAFFVFLPVAAQATQPADADNAEWDAFLAEYVAAHTLSDAEGTERLSVNVDWLEYLHANPMNINTASREDLLLIPYTTEAQADSILLYRDRHREFLSLGELLYVSGLMHDDRVRLSLFLCAEHVDAAPKWFAGENQHMLSADLGIPLYKRAGYKHYSDEELEKSPNKAYLGNALSNTLRYRFQRGQSVKAGITLQKDEGEPFAAKKNYPYDYLSAYAYIASPQEHWQVWAGDYDVRLAQGLLLGNTAFTLRSATSASASSRTTIKPHTSCSETSSYRGLAAALNLRRIHLAAWASYKALDANVQNDTITTFYTSGLHRTQAELQHRNAARLLSLGASATYQKGRLSATLAANFDHYSHPVARSDQLYNRYFFRGSTAFAASLSYAYRARKKWQFAGEAAVDRSGHAATIHTVRFEPSTNLLFTFQGRALSKRFVSLHGNALQENSHTQNEYGADLAFLFRPSSTFSLQGYIDYFHFPWATYKARFTNTQGVALDVQSQYAPTDKLNFTLRYHLKTKQTGVTAQPSLLQYATTHRLSLSARFVPSSRLTLTAKADLTVSASQTKKSTFGRMLSARGAWKPTNRLSFDLMLAAFNTDDFSSRLYGYEPQLRFSAAFPSYYYQGMRAVAKATIKPLPTLQISARYAFLHYFNRSTIASGPQAINASSKNDLALQVIFTL